MNARELGKAVSEVVAIRKRIARCLDSETADRQTALEDADGMLADLYVRLAAG